MTTRTYVLGCELPEGSSLADFDPVKSEARRAATFDGVASSPHTKTIGARSATWLVSAKTRTHTAWRHGRHPIGFLGFSGGSSWVPGTMTGSRSR